MKLGVSQFSQKIYDVEILQDDLINGSQIFIGRADDCHIILDDQQVSRHHAIFYLKDAKVFIKKTSDFGTLSVNGNEISEVEVKLGDRIIVTSYMLQILDLPEVDTITQIPDEPIHEPEPIEEETQIFDDDIMEELTTAKDEEPITEVRSEFEGHIESDDETNDEENYSDSPLNNDYGDNGEEEASVNSDFSQEEEASFTEGEEDFSEDDSFGDEAAFGEEDAFGDDGGFGEDDGHEATQVFQSFANYYLTLEGENVPFDRYTIETGENFIGRDPEKCKIILDDNEVSGVHALIKKSLINCILEDLNSSNGTILNGERINKAELSNGDVFTIGSTTFTVEISSDLLESERGILMPVEDNQEVEVIEEVEEEVDFDEMEGENDEFGVSTEVEEKSIIKRLLKDKKKLYTVVGVILALVLLLPDDKPKKNKLTKKQKEALIAKKKAAASKKNNSKTVGKKLPPETLEKLEQNYALALAKYEAGEYYEAKEYLELIKGIDPNYKDTKTLLQLVKQGHEELLRLKREEEAEKERKLRQLKVEKLVSKAREAVKKREVQVAESLFGQVMEIDPENIDIPQMKMEIDAYKKSESDKKMAIERKKAERKRMVDALAPGKGLYLKGEWFKAIDRLEKFLNMKGMDEDLVKEATSMLKTSQKKLSAVINPLLGKARSFKEGQDLKRAYETYGEVLKYDPSNEESLNERENINETLTLRSRRMYREALISESLSLFEEAKEKFQQVQQISPINSEYYIKATDKLKNYLE